MVQVSPPPSWVLVGFALLTLAGCGGAGSRYLSYVGRGEQYLAAGNLDKAGVEFRNALQIKPKDVRARYDMGQVQERRGNLREALACYLAVIDADPAHTQARAAAARVMVFGGLASRALAVLEPGLKQHPNDPQLLTARGAARAQLKDLTGALADGERAVRIAPHDEIAVALLASLYQRQGDTARAIELVATTLKQLPGSLDLREVLASLYVAANDKPHAEEQLQKIVTLAPRDLSRRYQLAGFYLRSADLPAAQRVLEDAVRVAPHDNGAKLTLVDFLASRRSRADAEQVLRAYIAHEPGDAELRLGLGALLQRTGSAAEAIAAYQEIITRDPAGKDAVTAHDRIAAIQMGGGHLEEASREVALALQQSPRDDDALTVRGSIALDRGDAAAAIEDFRAVLHDQPNALPLQRALAKAYHASGQDTLAEETLRNAMQAAPGDTPVRIDLAQLLLRTGRADAATTLLEETVRSAPQDTAAREALGRVYLATRDYLKARTAAEDLKTLAPKAAAGPYLAGLVAQQQGRFDDSVREFEHALQLAPSSMDALSALARVQLAHGQSTAAVARVRSYTLAHPSDAAAVNLLAETLIATRSYAEAGQQLDRAIQLAPRWALPYNNLALARLAAANQAGAVEAYQAGLKQLPDEPQLVTGLANLYEQQGHVDQAIALYQQLYARHPRLELAANNLAMLLANYRTDQQSLDRARDLTAAFSSSNDAALLDTNGWVRLKMGDVAEALPTLEHAVDRAPDSKVIHYHLAMAQLKAGQRDKARANLEVALSGAVHFVGSADARATLNKLGAGTT